jgi:hypothetical protein
VTAPRRAGVGAGAGTGRVAAVADGGRPLKCDDGTTPARMDAPVDTWHAWLGLAVASLALVGTAASLPTAPPPDAAGVADTVDRTAVATGVATARHPLSADAIRLGPDAVALRNDAGTARARLAWSATPVVAGDPLAAVLHGAPPERAFADRASFHAAVEAAREREPTWRPAPETLVVRRVTWGEVGVTLVGA